MQKESVLVVHPMASEGKDKSLVELHFTELSVAIISLTNRTGTTFCCPGLARVVSCCCCR